MVGKVPADCWPTTKNGLRMPQKKCRERGSITAERTGQYASRTWGRVVSDLTLERSGGVAQTGVPVNNNVQIGFKGKMKGGKGKKDENWPRDREGGGGGTADPS